MELMGSTLRDIKTRGQCLPKPKISWENRRFSPRFGKRGDFWLVELMERKGRDYIMEDIISQSREISLELFCQIETVRYLLLHSNLGEGIQTQRNMLEYLRDRLFGTGMYFCDIK
jgi:hypothetical protein